MNHSEDSNRLEGIITVPRAEYLLWCKRRMEACDNHASAIAPDMHNKPTTGSPFGFALPPELLLEILGYLKESQSTLYSVSLVCRQWMLCAAPLLYRHAKIMDTFRYATFILTLTRNKKTLHYGSLVHTLDLAAGNKPFGQSNSSTATTTETTTTDFEGNWSINITSNDTSTTISNEWSTNEPEYYEARDMKHGHLFVTTSSLLQVARSCKNLTCLNLSLTTLFFDSLIEETGEYLSTLQHYAVQPGLTQILIPMDKVIETLGHECPSLQEVKMQRCDWVTAHTIWLWVTHCPKLIRLDARRSNKCSVKKLIANVLEAAPEGEASIPDEVMMQQDADAPLVETSEEEEERVFLGGIRHRRFIVPQQQEVLNMRSFREFDQVDQPLAQRLHPAAIRRLSVSRRPRPASSDSEWRSLKQVVYDILKEAKIMGAADLNWFH
ncbi:hypothetical protein BJV82DRAFT_630905 [Fennellomyces sp. T-0311]|nr:hypothetical protein BJV82DRAFT_630905 [Fennellomyces sp. T-0311]